MGDKLVDGIKIMCINILTCVRVKGDENKCFRIDSGVRQGCNMFPRLFNVHMDAVMGIRRMDRVHMLESCTELQKGWIK